MEPRFIPGTQAGVHLANTNARVTAKLLHHEYYRTGAAVQEAQAEGAHDWEYGERVSLDDEWTPVQRLAYFHGWRNGHTRCDCAVIASNGKQYVMNDLPDSFEDW